MSSRRHKIGASRRRRRDEEGEDEGPNNGELEDDSLSEGSAPSHPGEDDADAGGTDGSDDEASTSVQADKSKNLQVNGRQTQQGQQSGRSNSVSPAKAAMTPTASDTEAMLNGLKVSDQTGEVAELHFDDLKEGTDPNSGRTPSAPPTQPRRQSFAERRRREHDKYVKERDANPAFVPTRGRFFLHDKRTDAAANSQRPFNKPKSKPQGLIVDGNLRKQQSKPVASEGQWAHDLHDTVAEDRRSPRAPVASNAPSNSFRPVPTAPKSTPPNRSFSSTTLIGNVPTVVLLPGMTQPLVCSAVAKKQHTRLPEHRPPLRRDKPVRISLPGHPPKYIFPSTERSFIFIPRALRPNQQSFRGRGRGNYYTGRRPSHYSSYTPSVSMSRRSSMGMAASQDAYPSPAASVLSRPSMATMEKPVVRLPPQPSAGVVPPTAAGPPPSGMPQPLPQPPPPPQPQHWAYRESRPAPIPMHQPRPRKAVSVADIDRFPFTPPQPHQEQPFHYQVPPSGHDAPGHPSLTPSTHIPDQAIHAQPFQPYGVQQPQGYYPMAYPGGMYYPTSGPDVSPYTAPMGPAATNFHPGQQTPYMMPAPHTPAEQPSLPGTVAHEAGGTVYFYDANQMYPNSSFPMPPQGSGMGSMNGMTPSGPTYYYPQPQGEMYYGGQ